MLTRFLEIEGKKDAHWDGRVEKEGRYEELGDHQNQNPNHLIRAEINNRKGSKGDARK